MHEFIRKNKETIIIVLVLLCMFIVVFGSLYNNRNDSNVIINEVCPHNKSIIHDRVGNYSDYIELYNSSNKNINISGWYISDRNNEFKYQFPKNTVIGSNEYLIVWAGEKEGYGIYLTEDDYVTGFSLTDGESIYLCNRFKTVVDSTDIPVEIGNDIVWARNENGFWSYQEASPNKDNIGDILNVEYAYVEPPKFSRESGFYEEPFNLELFSENMDYKIYYTLDGADPRILDNALEYKNPIYIEDVTYKNNQYASIDDIFLPANYAEKYYSYIPQFPVDKTNIVRAICIDENGNFSDEIIHSYFVDYSNKQGYDNVYKLSIVTNPENLFGYENGIYVTGQTWDNTKEQFNGQYYETAVTNYSQNWKREAWFELYNEFGIIENAQYGKISIHGNWSIIYNQKSFNIKAFDGDYLFGNLFGNPENTYMLRAGGYRDLYSTKFRDVLNQRLVEGRNISTLRAIPVQVFIDGEYWGLYNLQERINASYFEAHYGIDKDNIVIVKNSSMVEGETEYWDQYQDIINFAKENDMSIEENYKHICELIDIESYMEYYCYQIYVANVDSVTNNFALWRSKYQVDGNPYSDGKWRYILFDTDDSVGMFWLANYDINSFTNNLGKPLLEDDLFRELLKNQTFKQSFINCFEDMCDSCWNIDVVDYQINMIEEQYSEPAVLSAHRYMDYEYSLDDYKKEVNVVKEFYQNRKEYILEHLYEELDKDFSYEVLNENSEKKELEQSAKKESLKEMNILSAIIFLFPAFITLFITNAYKVDNKKDNVLLLIQWGFYTFLIVMLSYVILYLLKGRIYISWDSMHEDFDNNIFKVNVVAGFMAIEFIVAFVIGICVRIIKKIQNYKRISSKC